MLVGVIRLLVMASKQVRIIKLEGEPAEMAELQRVIEQAPRFAYLITGVPPGPADAQSTYTILPEGKSYEDKFVFGIYADDEMVGCIDLIRGYPDSRTAWLGLLLISEKHQRRGFGAQAHELVENVIHGWETCDRIRVAAVKTNEDVIPFFERLGYRATGEITPYRYGSIESERLTYEKPLAR